MEENVENKQVEQVVEEKSLSPVEEAKKAVELLKEQNEIMAKQLREAQELVQTRILGGESFGGQPQKTAEQKAVDSARNLLAGTGYEYELFPEEQ